MEEIATEMPAVPDDRMLCYCKNVRYGAVRAAVERIDARRVDEVTLECDAGGGCRTCHPEIQAVIDEHRRGRGSLLARLLRKLFARS